MDNKSFSFGKNWYNYLLSNFSESSLSNAIKSIQVFIGKKSLRNKTFLDIGCGSGLFSLAAYRMGAKKIVSFDYDSQSVNCCRLLKNRENMPNNWEISQGSILDKKLIKKLGKFDVVYSWGVLHHTGKMWKAIENASRLVKPKGLMYISIYNERTAQISSRQWLMVKRLYSNSPMFFKKILEYIYIIYFFSLYRFKINKIKNYIRNYSKFSRGMSWRTDVTDWMGGYHYEFAKADKVLSYCQKLGLKEIKHTDLEEGTGCNEFLFQRV